MTKKRRKGKPKRKARTPLTRKGGATKRHTVAKRPTGQKLRHKRPMAKRPAAKRPAARHPKPSKAVVRLERQKSRSRRTNQSRASKTKAKARVRETKARLQAKIHAAVERERKRLRNQAKRALAKAKQEIARLKKQSKQQATPKNERLRKEAEREAERVRQEALTREAERKRLSKRFRSLFPKLKAKAKANNQLPKIDTRRRRMLSDHVEGQRRSKRLDIELTERSLEQIMYELEQLAAQLGGYRLWLAHIGFEAMGSLSYVSAFEVLDSEEEGAPEFQFGVANTGYFNEKERMMIRARKILEGWLDDVGRHALVFVSFVEVRNYNHRRG